MSAVLVGWGHTPFGRHDGVLLEDLIVRAAREAIADADLCAEDIDAVWLVHIGAGVVPDAFTSSIALAADPDLLLKHAAR